MEFTLEELKERLAKFEETYLLELLQVSSEQLVDRFDDVIELRYDDLMKELENLGDKDEEDSDFIGPVGPDW